MAQPHSGGAGKGSPKALFGYDVVGHIGEGALSSIYRVKDPKSGQVYALKHVTPTDEKHSRFLEQLENEYNVSKLFRHPALRKCVDYKVKKRLFGGITEAALVLELVEGPTLQENCPTDLRAQVDVFQKVGVALSALHYLRYLHCDIKPRNIFLLPDGKVKLIDFGQACLNGTTKQRVQGTPDFIAPEQVKCEAVTSRTDVYNLGATMYWVLTGAHVPTLYTIKRDENSFLTDAIMTSPAERNPNVPDALSHLVMECVKVNPAKRPDMPDVARRLDVIHYRLQRSTGLSPQGQSQQSTPPSMSGSGLQRFATV